MANYFSQEVSKAVHYETAKVTFFGSTPSELWDQMVNKILLKKKSKSLIKRYMEKRCHMIGSNDY